MRVSLYDYHLRLRENVRNAVSAEHSSQHVTVIVDELGEGDVVAHAAGVGLQLVEELDEIDSRQGDTALGVGRVETEQATNGESDQLTQTKTPCTI